MNRQEDDEEVAVPRTPPAAADDGVDGSGGEDDGEYGLRGLAELPLLEQVHRLFHAIQCKYPYTETHAWKTLPLEQKRRMLDYIRERRAKKPIAESMSEATPSVTTTAPTASQDDAGATITTATAAVAAAATATGAPAVDGTAGRHTVRSDPYLQMLQKRTLRVTSAMPGTAGAGIAHPNSTYVAGKPPVSEYVETAPRRGQFKARWKLVDAEFYENPACTCGVKHDDLMQHLGGSKSNANALLATISAMMSTFGDAARPCLAAVRQVRVVVGDYLQNALRGLMEDGEIVAPCLRTLVEIFPEEAAYYGRWREFRVDTKQEEPDLEDVEEDELAEELDLFAVSEADAVFNAAFLERIRFADERTREMDWTIYDAFAKSRKINFMHQKGAAFRQWLHLASCSRAALEFMNFVTYHNIGRLVELAIKTRTGGRLQALETPLLKNDIENATDAFRDESRYRSQASPGEGNARVDGGAREGDVSRNTQTPDAETSEPPTKTRRLGTDGTLEASVTPGSTPSTTPTTTPQRLTRLKRLR